MLFIAEFTGVIKTALSDIIEKKKKVIHRIIVEFLRTYIRLY